MTDRLAEIEQRAGHVRRPVLQHGEHAAVSHEECQREYNEIRAAARAVLEAYFGDQVMVSHELARAIVRLQSAMYPGEASDAIEAVS